MPLDSASLSSEVVIIGAGPIGLELAVALKKNSIDYLHFDSRQIGHTVSWFAPQTRFFSSNERIAIAGVPLFTPDQGKATREEYLAYLRSIVRQFDLNVRTYQPVTNIERHQGDFILSTQCAGQTCRYRVQKLILSTGGTERARRLDIPGEDLPHVSHYFQDPHAYFQKNLLVIGGRNSAVEAALRCHHAGANVAISYRQNQFDANSIKYWLYPEITGLIKSGRIAAHFNTRPIEIAPCKAILVDQTGKKQEIPADFVLLLVGYEADMTLFHLAGVELKSAGQAPIFDPATMETNIPNLYVAGTAVCGTQEHYAVFIENCHDHVARILAALTGSAPPAPSQITDRPET